MYQLFLSSFSAEVHTAKSSHFHNKINNAPDMRNLFRTFNSLLCPPSPPPTTSITADDFATFFTIKTKTISSQFSPPLTQDPQPTRSTAQTPIFSFCPLTEAEVSKLLLSSHPTTCPLDPIPSHLLQAISPTLLPALTHIINTSLLTGIFPTAFKQARVTSGNSGSFGQKSWCNLRWPADLQRAHCKECSILQVCIAQHQKDQALSDRACCTTSCPGPCHF